jgi:hypothetical protein
VLLLLLLLLLLMAPEVPMAMLANGLDVCMAPGTCCRDACALLGPWPCVPAAAWQARLWPSSCAAPTACAAARTVAASSPPQIALLLLRAAFAGLLHSCACFLPGRSAALCLRTVVLQGVM